MTVSIDSYKNDSLTKQETVAIADTTCSYELAAVLDDVLRLGVHMVCFKVLADRVAVNEVHHRGQHVPHLCQRVEALINAVSLPTLLAAASPATKSGFFIKLTQ